MEVEESQDITSSSDVEPYIASSQDCPSESNGVGPDAHVSQGGTGLVDLLLDRQYRVTRFLRRDNHADVYSILCLPSASECFEARVYELDGLSPKVRQYRLRNIKRLSHRTVLETRWEGRTVVVYKSGSKPIQDWEVGEANEASPTEIPTSEGTVLAVENTRIKRKINSHQQESARIRQLERRQTKRRDRRRVEASSNSTEGTSKLSEAEADGPLETAEEEALYVLLYIAHSDRLQLRDQLPAATRLVLERYLEKKDLNFPNDNELEAFMKTKQHELLFLRRQQKKLPAVLKSRHDEFEQILRAKPPYHLQHKERQQSLQIAQHRYKVIRNVSDILPNLINEVDTVYRELRRRLSLARQKKKEVENLIALGTERERLTRQAAVHQKSLRAVVPASGPYAQVVAQLAAAVKELRCFETRHSSSEISLDPLLDYKKLIGSENDPAVSTQAYVDEFAEQIGRLNIMFRGLAGH